MDLQNALKAAAGHLSAGRNREAALGFAAIADAHPENAPAHFFVGALALQAGRNEAAARSLKRALELQGAPPQVHELLGQALTALGRSGEAEECYLRAIALNPGLAASHFGLGGLLEARDDAAGAVESYRRGLALQPQAPEVHYNLGRLLENLERLEEAEAAYREALAQKPDLAPAHANLGAIFRRRQEWERAEASCRQALDLDPELLPARVNLAGVLRHRGRLEEAEACYRQALERQPDNPVLHFELSNVLIERGRSEEAASSCRRALELQPDFAQAHRNLAMTRRHRDEDGEVRAMQDLYARPDLPAEERTHLAFGLGKAYEEMGQYDAAFDCWEAGNAILAAERPYRFDLDKRAFDAVKETFSQEFFARHGEGGAPGEAAAEPMFILGMPRSGTSLVEQILASHPQVAGAGESPALEQVVLAGSEAGGAHYPLGIPALETDAFARLGAEYRERMANAFPEAARISDKMPHNFRFVGMIRLMLPGARVIHCLRDPRDTCLSIFKTFFPEGGHAYACDLEALGHHYGLYRDLMDHWRAVLPGFMHEVRYEELVADPDAGIRSLLAACDLDFDPACLDFHRSERGVRTASALQVRQPAHRNSVAAWKRYEQRLGTLLAVLG